MNDISYVFLGYFLTVLFIYLFMFKWTRKEPIKQDRDDGYKRSDLLIPDKDYIEEFGVIDLDRDEIISSDFFEILLGKVPKISSDIEGEKLFYDIVKKLQPYSMTDLFRTIQYLRQDTESSPERIRAYKTHVTASAIVYDFVIPKALFNDDSVVLTYVAAHMRLHRPVSVFDEVQSYIKQEPTEKTGMDIVEKHKEIERFIVDMDFANVFLSMVFKHEAFLSIEYLYGRWLEQPAVNAFNQSFYKQDINHFKKLVTIYFGIFEIDVPKEYLYFNTAVCEYILQIRRYDPNKAKVRVVE